MNENGDEIKEELDNKESKKSNDELVVSKKKFLDDEGKLYAGLQQLNNVLQTVIYDLNYNIVENNLEY